MLVNEVSSQYSVHKIMSSSREIFNAVANSNQANVSVISESKTESEQDDLEAEIKINEREIDQAFLEMQKARPDLVVSDPLQGIYLRKDLDSLQHTNLLKRQRLAMLTGTANELNCRLTGNFFPSIESKALSTRLHAEEVERKFEAEEILKSQLEHIYTRVAKKIAILKVSYTELEDKYKRVSRHYVKTQNTEFVALNCEVAAANQKAQFLKTVQQTRTNYHHLKTTLEGMKANVKIVARKSLEQMSATTLENREKVYKKRSLNATIQSALESHHVTGGLMKVSKDRLGYFFRLFAEIQLPLYKYGLKLNLQTGLSSQDLVDLIDTYKDSIQTETSLKVRFQELSQAAIEKRNECDNIRAYLISLKADELLELAEKPMAVSLNLLNENLKSAEECTARLEQTKDTEEAALRLYFKFQEAIKIFLGCFEGIEGHVKFKREMRVLCEQLRIALTSAPKSAELRNGRLSKKDRSKSSANTSRASTSLLTTTTDTNSDEARFSLTRQRTASLGRSSSFQQYISSVYYDSNVQMARDARELEKSNFISYFGDIDKAINSDVPFENPGLVFTQIVQDASNNLRETLAMLVERGRGLIQGLIKQSKRLKSRLEITVQSTAVLTPSATVVSKSPDKLTKTKDDLDGADDDLHSFKKRSQTLKQLPQSLSRKKAKSCDYSFEEVEEMPKVSANLRVYKTELKNKLEACAAKMLNPKSIRKPKTGEHRYASLPPSELKSVIQEVKYYDTAIKALYSTEKKAKMKLPLQTQPLLSRKIRISSSKAQLATMRSLTSTLQLRSSFSPYNML